MNFKQKNRWIFTFEHKKLNKTDDKFRCKEKLKFLNANKQKDNCWMQWKCELTLLNWIEEIDWKNENNCLKVLKQMMSQTTNRLRNSNV
jgi:hypothetical protein